MPGTEPKTFDEVDEYNASRAETIEENLRRSLIDTDMAGAAKPPIDVPAPDTNPPIPHKGNPLLD